MANDNVKPKSSEGSAEAKETPKEISTKKIISETADSNSQYDQGRRTSKQLDEARRSNDGEPSRDTKTIGFRAEIVDGDKTLVKGYDGSDAKAKIKMPEDAERSSMSGTITSPDKKEACTIRDGILYDAAGKVQAILDSKGRLHFDGKAPVELNSLFSGWKFEGSENGHSREVLLSPQLTNGSLTIPQESGPPIKAEVRLGMVINTETKEQIAILEAPKTETGKLTGGSILYGDGKPSTPLCNVRGAVFDLETVGEGRSLGFQSRRMQGIAIGPQELTVNGVRKDVGGILDLQAARDLQQKLLEHERAKGNESGVRNAQDSLTANGAVVESGRTDHNLTSRLQNEFADADRQLNPLKQYDPKQLERLPVDCSRLNGTALIASDKAPNGKMEIAVKNGKLMSLDGKEAIGRINPDGSVTFKDSGTVSMRDLVGSSWNLTDSTDPAGPRQIKWLSMGNQGMYSISNAIGESHNEEIKYAREHKKDYESWTTLNSTVDAGFKQNQDKAVEFRARMQRLAEGSGNPDDIQALLKGPKDYIENKPEQNKAQEKTVEKPNIELPKFDDTGAKNLADLRIRVGNEVYVTKPESPGQLFKSKDGLVEDKPCGKALGNYKIEVDGRTIDLANTPRVLMEFRTSKDDPKVHRVIGMGPGHVGEHGQQVKGGIVSQEQLLSDAKFLKEQADRGNIAYFNKRPLLTGRLTNWLIGDAESSLKAASGQIEHQTALMNNGFDTMFRDGFDQKTFANDRLDGGVNAMRWAADIADTRAADAKVIGEEARRYQQQVNDAVVMVAIGAATAGVGLKAALLRGAAVSAIGRQTEGGGLSDLAGNAVGGALEAGSFKLMTAHAGLKNAGALGAAVVGESVGAAAMQRISNGLRGQEDWHGAQTELKKLGWGAMWNAVGMGLGTKFALSEKAQLEIGKIAQNSVLKGSIENFVKNAPREAIQNFTTSGLEAMGQGIEMERERIAHERGIPVDRVSDAMLAEGIRWGNVLGTMGESGVMAAATGIASTTASSRHGAMEMRKASIAHDTINAQQTPPEATNATKTQQTPPETTNARNAQQTPLEATNATKAQQTPPEATDATKAQQSQGANKQPRRLPVEFDPTHAERDQLDPSANRDRIARLDEHQAKNQRTTQPDDGGSDGASSTKPQQQKQLKAVGYYGDGSGVQDGQAERREIRSVKRFRMIKEESGGDHTSNSSSSTTGDANERVGHSDNISSSEPRKLAEVDHNQPIKKTNEDPAAAERKKDLSPDDQSPMRVDDDYDYLPLDLPEHLKPQVAQIGKVEEAKLKAEQLHNEAEQLRRDTLEHKRKSASDDGIKLLEDMKRTGVLKDAKKIEKIREQLRSNNDSTVHTAIGKLVNEASALPLEDRRFIGPSLQTASNKWSDIGEMRKTTQADAKRNAANEAALEHKRLENDLSAELNKLGKDDRDTLEIARLEVEEHLREKQNQENEKKVLKLVCDEIGVPTDEEAGIAKMRKLLEEAQKSPPPDAVYRGDSNLGKSTDSRGRAKSHVDVSGDYVPADVNGIYKGAPVSVIEHINGGTCRGAKASSPFHSGGETDAVLDKYGVVRDKQNSVLSKKGDVIGVKIDMKALRAAIANGEVPGVSIIEHTKVLQAILDAKIDWQYKRKLFAFAAKDKEVLIRGVIPKKFIKPEVYQ